jgi:hypothetical protein
MSGHDLVRAWKDPDYRGNDVDNPAGEITLDQVGGNAAEAASTERLFTIGCNCQGFTTDLSVCATTTMSVLY